MRSSLSVDRAICDDTLWPLVTPSRLPSRWRYELPALLYCIAEDWLDEGQKIYLDDETLAFATFCTDPSRIVSRGFLVKHPVQQGVNESSALYRYEADSRYRML